MLMLNFLLWLVKSLIDDVEGLPTWDLNLKELLSVADTMTGQINLLHHLLLLLCVVVVVVIVVKNKDNSFQFTSIFIKKIIKLGFFKKITKPKRNRFQFGLVWLVFLFGFSSVWLFRFHAYKIETEPVGFLKILIDLIEFFLWFDFFSSNFLSLINFLFFFTLACRELPWMKELDIDFYLLLFFSLQQPQQIIIIVH